MVALVKRWKENNELVFKTQFLLQLNNLEIIRTVVKVDTITANCLAVVSDIECVLSKVC